MPTDTPRTTPLLADDGAYWDDNLNCWRIYTENGDGTAKHTFVREVGLAVTVEGGDSPDDRQPSGAMLEQIRRALDMAEAPQGHFRMFYDPDEPDGDRRVGQAKALAGLMAKGRAVVLEPRRSEPVEGEIVGE